MLFVLTPSHFVPNVNDLVSVDIQRTSKDAGKFIYYFAANSKNMLGKDKEMIFQNQYIWKDGLIIIK